MTHAFRITGRLWRQTMDSSHKGPIIRSLVVFLVVCLNKPLKKESSHHMDSPQFHWPPMAHTQDGPGATILSQKAPRSPPGAPTALGLYSGSASWRYKGQGRCQGHSPTSERSSPSDVTVLMRKKRATMVMFQYKRRLFRYVISILKIRRSWDCLIFMMGIPVLVRRHIYIQTTPCFITKL